MHLLSSSDSRIVSPSHSSDSLIATFRHAISTHRRRTHKPPQTAVNTSPSQASSLSTHHHHTPLPPLQPLTPGRYEKANKAPSVPYPPCPGRAKQRKKPPAVLPYPAGRRPTRRSTASPPEVPPSHNLLARSSARKRMRAHRGPLRYRCICQTGHIRHRAAKGSKPSTSYSPVRQTARPHLTLPTAGGVDKRFVPCCPRLSWSYQCCVAGHDIVGTTV